MKITRQQLNQLEWILCDRVHDFGQSAYERVMSGFYDWAKYYFPLWCAHYGFSDAFAGSSQAVSASNSGEGVKKS